MLLQEVREEKRNWSHPFVHSHNVLICHLCIVAPISALHLLTEGVLKMQPRSCSLYQTGNKTNLNFYV